VVDVTPLYETRVKVVPSSNHIPCPASWGPDDFDPRGSVHGMNQWERGFVTGLALDASGNAWEENARDWNAYLLTDENENHFASPELLWLECGEPTELQHLFPLALTGGHVFRAIARASLPDLWFTAPGREQLFMVNCKLADIPSRQDAWDATRARSRAAEQRRSTDSSTEARELVSWIEARLADRSIEELGRLVSVSRATWSGWRRGDQLIRSGSRRRLIRLKRLLELRLAVAPESSVNLWLDTPVGSNLDVTPASLLAEGRDATVAMLAAQPPSVPEDGLVLTMPMDLGGLEDDAATAAKLERRAAVGGSDDPE
jgi:hypothetical protein